MTNSNTRSKLVEVARQLFARDGVDATTMNDIALASKKGRRTLYTYFKCKEDLYMAVIESELSSLNKRMEMVAQSDVPPAEKILDLIFTHLDAMREVVYRNGTLRGLFFRDIWKVENARKNFDIKEIGIIKGILEKGVENGTFCVDDTLLLAQIIHFCVKGIEVPYTRGIIGANLDDEKAREYVSDIVLGALGINKKEESNS